MRKAVPPNVMPAKPEEQLLSPTAEEVRNGWTTTSLTKFLRAACSTDFEFCREIVIRVRQRQHEIVGTIAALKRDAGIRDADTEIDDPDTKAQLAALEKELGAATAAVRKATERLILVEQAA